MAFSPNLGVLVLEFCHWLIWCPCGPIDCNQEHIFSFRKQFPSTQQGNLLYVQSKHSAHKETPVKLCTHHWTSKSQQLKVNNFGGEDPVLSGCWNTSYSVPQLTGVQGLTHTHTKPHTDTQQRQTHTDTHTDEHSMLPL